MPFARRKNWRAGFLPVVSEAEGADVGAETVRRGRPRICFEWRAALNASAGFDRRRECVHASVSHCAGSAEQRMKHGKARELLIVLAAEGGEGILAIHDDGMGLPDVLAAHRDGIEYHELSGQNGGRIAGSASELRAGNRWFRACFHCHGGLRRLTDKRQFFAE